MTSNANDKPPLFPKWSHWYVFVIAALVIEALLLSLFTNYFS